MPKLGTYGSVRGALSNGCLYRDCGLSTNHYLRPNPAQRPGYAHAVLGREHARIRGSNTPRAIGARLTPQSPVASPNHCA